MTTTPKIHDKKNNVIHNHDESEENIDVEDEQKIEVCD